MASKFPKSLPLTESAQPSKGIQEDIDLTAQESLSSRWQSSSLPYLVERASQLRGTEAAIEENLQASLRIESRKRGIETAIAETLHSSSRTREQVLQDVDDSVAKFPSSLNANLREGIQRRGKRERHTCSLKGCGFKCPQFKALQRENTALAGVCVLGPVYYDSPIFKRLQVRALGINPYTDAGKKAASEDIPFKIPGNCPCVPGKTNPEWHFVAGCRQCNPEISDEVSSSLSGHGLVSTASSEDSETTLTYEELAAKYCPCRLRSRRNKLWGRLAQGCIKCNPDQHFLLPTRAKIARSRSL